MLKKPKAREDFGTLVFSSINATFSDIYQFVICRLSSHSSASLKAFLCTLPISAGSTKLFNWILNEDWKNTHKTYKTQMLFCVWAYFLKTPQFSAFPFDESFENTTFNSSKQPFWSLKNTLWWCFHHIWSPIF